MITVRTTSLAGTHAVAAAIAGLARDLELKSKPADNERKVACPTAWATESSDLAIAKAYAFNGTLIDFAIDTNRNGPSTAPRLPDGYEAEMKAVAQRRVALGGYRLADLLKATLAD